MAATTTGHAEEGMITLTGPGVRAGEVQGKLSITPIVLDLMGGGRADEIQCHVKVDVFHESAVTAPS